MKIQTVVLVFAVSALAAGCGRKSEEKMSQKIAEKLMEASMKHGGSEKGWKEEASINSDDGMARVYTKEARRVNVTIASEEGLTRVALTVLKDEG